MNRLNVMGVGLLGAAAIVGVSAGDFWSEPGPGGTLGADGTSTLRSEIVVSEDLIIGSFDAVDLFGFSYDFQGDLTITLTHKDTGTTAVLWDGLLGGGAADFLFGDYAFSDGGTPLDHSGVDQGPDTYNPDSPLSVFNGESTLGTWSLNMTDAFPTSGGGGFDSWDFHATIVPAPGAIALIGLAGLAGRRRRR